MPLIFDACFFLSHGGLGYEVSGSRRGRGGWAEKEIRPGVRFCPETFAEGRKLAGFCLFDYQIGN
jgi:hypothetical protein